MFFKIVQKNIKIKMKINQIRSNYVFELLRIIVMLPSKIKIARFN